MKTDCIHKPAFEYYHHKYQWENYTFYRAEN